MIEVDTVEGPAYWASALINGDDSSFDVMDPNDAQTERDALQLFADGWYVVSVADDPETGEPMAPYFSWRYGAHGGTAQGGDLLTYVVHREAPNA